MNPIIIITFNIIETVKNTIIIVITEMQLYIEFMFNEIRVVVNLLGKYIIKLLK